MGRRAKRLSKGDSAVSEYVKTCDLCELRDSVSKVICIGKLTPHHIQKRTKIATRHDLENILIVCENHHHYIETHPVIARKNGWRIDGKSMLLPS